MLLARPWVLGIAINDLLARSPRGLILLVVQYLVYTIVSVGRQMYDTRMFSAIYNRMAAQLVLEQRRRHVATSRVAARSALSREIVDFFERDVPFVLRAGYCVLGSLAMLVMCDGLLIPVCLLLLLPVYTISSIYARKAHTLNGRLNDRLEGEVDVIEQARASRVRRHYDVVALWRIRLSDLQAYNHGIMHVLFLGLIAVALVRCCLYAPGDAGQIFATIGYVTIFVAGLMEVPSLVQQWSRLRDIQQRMNPVA